MGLFDFFKKDSNSTTDNKKGKSGAEKGADKADPGSSTNLSPKETEEQKKLRMEYKLRQSQDMAKELERLEGLIANCSDIDNLNKMEYMLQHFQGKITGYRKEAEGIASGNSDPGIRDMMIDINTAEATGDVLMRHCKEAVTKRRYEFFKTECVDYIEGKRKEDRWDSGERKERTAYRLAQLRKVIEDVRKRKELLPAADSKESKALDEEIDQIIKRYERLVDGYEKSMSSSGKESKGGKKESQKKKLDDLNKKYGETNPYIRVIRLAYDLRDGDVIDKRSKIAKAADAVSDTVNKVKDPLDSVQDAASPVTEFNGNLEDDEKELIKDQGSQILNWLKEKGMDFLSGSGGSDSEGNDFTKLFDPLKGCYDTIKGMIGLFSKMNDASIDELEESMIDDVVGPGIETIASSLSVLSEVLSNIPILGILPGLIGNLASFLVNGYHFFKDYGRYRTMKKSKEALEEKMAAKQDKYNQRADAPVLDIMGEDEKGKLYVDKETASHNRSVLEKHYGENLTANIDELKEKKRRGNMTEDEKVDYYAQKSLALMRQHEELKEAKHVNHKRMRESGIQIAHTVVDTLANLGRFIPGYGTAVGLGLKGANALAKLGHKGFTKAKQAYHNLVGDEKSVENKEKRRGGMALDIYEKMVSVGQYMKPENGSPEEPMFQVPEDRAGKVSERVESIVSLLKNTGTKTSLLLGSREKSMMIDYMAQQFSREGAK